ncbi:hypothetical protein RSAG8_10797, partial [Rhizoctonia solani AG-8 WAC10335]
MKKVGELWSRSKAKTKEIFERVKTPSRASTPIPPNNPSETTSPFLGQTSSHPLPNPAGSSVSISLLASTANQGEPTVPATEQLEVPSHTPPVHNEALAANSLSAPASHRRELSHLNNKMKKIGKLGSRFKAKMKEMIDSDEAATRPSTPIPPNNTSSAISSTLGQAPSHPLSNPAGSSVSISLLASTANRGEPVVPAAEQVHSHTPSTNAEALTSTIISTPALHPAESSSPVVERTAALPPPDPAHKQAPAKPSHQTANIEAAATPAAGTVPPTSPSASNIAPVPSGLGVSSWIKSEGWANLKACLDTLNQAASESRDALSASVSGLGPLKTVIEGIAGCIENFEDAAQGQEAYSELRAELGGIFQELQQYLALSPAVAANVSDVCGLIQLEIDYVKSQQARRKVRKLAEAEQDEDNVLACYKRMGRHLQGLSRKMGISTLAIVEQNAMDDRLERLTPALSARYNSGNALALKRGPCTEGTRTKVLEDLDQWAGTQNTGNIYWMSGMAGTGKTTVEMYTVVTL